MTANATPPLPNGLSVFESCICYHASSLPPTPPPLAASISLRPNTHIPLYRPTHILSHTHRLPPPPLSRSVARSLALSHTTLCPFRPPSLDRPTARARVGESTPVGHEARELEFAHVGVDERLPCLALLPPLERLAVALPSPAFPGSATDLKYR